MLPANQRTHEKVVAMRSRITRLYNYPWTGAPRRARFDAGLVSLNGSTRKAYTQFKRSAKRFDR